MIFQYGLEGVLIQRMLIGYEAKLEIIITAQTALFHKIHPRHNISPTIDLAKILLSLIFEM